MSWIIERLLNDSLEIRGRIDTEFDPYNDDYNDLFLIENAIKMLTDRGLLTVKDLEVLEYMKGGNRVSSSTKESKGERNTVAKKYTDVCERIAFYLGGYFTDDGYIAYIRNKYSLNSEQVETLRTFIKSNFKHKIIRQPIDNRRKENKNG